MRCDKAIRLVSDGLDAEPGASRNDSLEAHLAGCPSCRARRAELVRLQAAARACAPVPEPGDLSRSLSRVQESIRREAAVTLAAGAGPKRAGWGWLPAGAAASLLAAAAGAYLLFLRPSTTVEALPYAYADARSSLVVSLSGDDDLASAFDSALGAELAESNGRFSAAVESRSVDTGRLLDSLTDDEVTILEAALENGTAL